MTTSEKSTAELQNDNEPDFVAATARASTELRSQNRSSMRLGWTKWSKARNGRNESTAFGRPFACCIRLQ